MSNIQEAKKALNQAQLAFEIAKANLAFARMTKAEQRITIAKDVIAAIKAKEIIAKQRVYVLLKDEEGYELLNEEAEEKLARRETNGCQACALGSVFVCALKRDTSIDTEYLFDDEQTNMRQKLSPYFSEEQLALIESAFERDDFLHDDGEEHEGEVQRAIAFGDEYGTPATRLTAIMQNIVKNKGTFKP